MSGFSSRAVEVHSQDAWDFDALGRVLRFAESQDLNTVVLHRNDIVDRVIHPAKYFGADNDREYKSPFERYQRMFRTLQQYTPTRRTRPIQRRDFLRRFVDVAERRGIEVYLQNKELWFPDVLLELHPEVLKNGRVCPSAAFWEGFLEAKYTQLFEDIPGLAGIITSPGTTESRVSISSNRCKCDDCRAASAQDWYRALLMAMYRPISRAGKRLVVRDFSFNPRSLGELSSAIELLPEDVGVSLKNTPHDFYPTFPNNMSIEGFGTRSRWIEFDSMGQFLGWGVVPCVMIDDLRRRFRYSRVHGASGVVFRSDWEGLDGHTAFKTLNALNLHAGAVLARNPEVPDRDIYGAWLEGEGYYCSGLDATAKEVAANWVASVLGRTWSVIEKALYMNGCVVAESSMVPVSYEHMWWLAEEKNSLSRWQPDKSEALALTFSNVVSILEEKNQALGIASELLRTAEHGCEGLTSVAHDHLVASLSLLHTYARCMKAAGQSCIAARFILERDRSNEAPEESAALRPRLEEALRELRDLARELESFYCSTDYQHTVYMLLSSERLVALHDDIQQRVDESFRD